MVTTQKIANKINAELNSIAAEMNIAHEFKLMAHLGKGKDDNKIYGVLKVAGTKVKNTGGTTAGVISTKVTYVAEFITPTAQDNYYATIIEQVIGALVDTKSGGHFTENGETVVWTIERGVPKDYALRDNVGSSIPIAFTINATISANGLLNGVKEWRLDGQLIPYSKEVIVLNKDGVTISIAEFSRQKSVMLAQMQEFRFTIPYDKTNTVCTTLQNDILNGDFRKTYTLSYSDGVVSFSRVVSLYRSGDMGTQDGDSTDINVSFVEAGASSYTEGADTVTYKLGLFTFPFGKNSDNTLYFDSQANQQTYMNTQVANASGEQVIKAPNLNNTLTVSTSFDAGLSSAGVYEIVNYNYAVLKREVTNAETMYLYYWVNNATIGADGMVMLELEQDTVQTIMFNPNLEIPDCMIERAHLNRWVDNGNGTVSFDATGTSKLFSSENVNSASKKMVRREIAQPILETTKMQGYTISDWINDNIYGWNYIFLTPYNDPNSADVTTKINVLKNDGTTGTHEINLADREIQYHTTDDDVTVQGAMVCLCYPVYKGSGRIELVSNSVTGTIQQKYASSLKITLNENGFEKFKENNLGTALISAIKFSTVPPIQRSLYTQVTEQTSSTDDYTYSIVGDNLVIAQGTTSASGSIEADNGYGSVYLRGFNTGSGYGIVLVEHSRARTDFDVYYTNFANTFGKTSNMVNSQSISITQPQSADLTKIYLLSTGAWKNRYDSYSLRFLIYDGTGQLKTSRIYNIENWGNGTINGNIAWTVETTNDARIVFNLNISDSGTSIKVSDFAFPEFVSKLDIYLVQTSHAIVGDNKKTRYNPKLYSSEFYSLRLGTEHGGHFDYDVQKLNTQQITATLSEPIVPDITRSYFRITSLSNGIYNEQEDENLVGLVDSVDTTMPLNTNSYQKMLAENKNYYAQQTLGYIQSGFGALSGIATGAAAGALGGSALLPGVGTAAGAILGAGTGLLNSIGTFFGIANSINQDDTEKQRSAMCKNANGNVFLNVAYTTPGKYFEEYDIMQADKTKINDYMFMYGFKCGLIDSIANHIHTRKYFNYIKAEIEDIQGVSVSNMIRENFKQRFSNGIRFWNYATFATNGVQYEKENYELWLED